MAIEVKLPGLGEGIDSGDVLELLVKEGDTVKAEQGLMEFETDKATVTLPSPVAGKVLRILVAPGDSVPIGQVVAELEAVASGGASAAQPAAAPPAAKTAESASSAKPATAASSAPAEQPPAQPAPAQPAPTQPAPTQPAPTQPAGSRTEAPRQPASSQPTATAASTVPSQPPPPERAQLVPNATQDPESASVAAGPAVRRFAREVGVDLSMVAGTGAGGRITRDDVLRSVRESNAARVSSAPAPSTGMSVPAAVVTAELPAAAPVGGNKPLTLPGDASQDDYGPVRIERLSKIRKTIALQMHKSWSTVPRVTNFDDADVTDLEAFRQKSKDDYAAEGIKLTTMPFLMKAVATALRHHPAMNAVIDLENDQITYRDYVNLGVAVDTDRGLVVPNIRHADALGIPGIAKALADLAARVRKGDFGVNELRGGTFTISNLGAIGGTYSTPIINVPEVAILLVGRTRKLPVVMDDDSIQPRLMMPLSLSYDHRLVDGGTAARFLNDVIAYLEAPSRLLLAIS
jgi:pyruvate dehydrogenase E2 component (dihydrolipoamide acetyltransferase)